MFNNKNEFAEIKKDLHLYNITSNFEKFKKFNLLTPKILPLFEEFIIFGGYPLPTLTSETELKLLRLKEIHNTYIQNDIKNLAKIENIVQFNRVVFYLSVEICEMLNLNTACKEIGVSRRHLERFIFILEKNFCIKFA